MTYTVIWRRSAEEQLKSLWRQSDDPGEILAAARKIESRLIRNALSAGESRESDEQRIVLEAPLEIAFTVSRIDRIAAINSVWWTRPSQRTHRQSAFPNPDSERPLPFQ